MIKVTYKEIRAGMFTPAFDRLCNNPNLQEKVSYNVSRIAAKMHPKLEKAQNEFFEFVSAHAVKDEKGQIKSDPTKGPGSYVIQPELVEGFKKKLEEFDTKTIEVDRPKLSFKDLSTAKLAPNEWLGLEPIIHDLESVG